MAHKTAEDSLAEDIAVLGSAYGTTYHHARQELWRVSSNWDRYETLFGSKERVDILNSSSGNFWHAVQGMMHEYVLLGICRLTDPVGRGDRRNLSVARLLSVDPTDEKDQLIELVDDAIKSAGFARTWRDKRIAHNDLAHVLGDASRIEPSTGRKVSAAIVAIHRVLKWIQCRYFNGDLFLIDIGDSDANQLMTALARAKWLRDREKADLEAGNFDRLVNRDYKFPASDYGRDRRYADQALPKRPPPYSGKLPLNT